MEKNIKNIKKVLAKIEADPSCWNQKKWHCGTSHCFAGHAQIELTGKEVDSTSIIRRDARIYFGFTKTEADYYFASDRTLKELKTAVKPFYNRAGYNRAGYNRVGYNRDGYNRDGYNRAGYNRDGYNRDGYNRAGYDRAGYNRVGYNRDGYNRDGYNRAGCDRDGYDRDGYDRAGYDRDGLNAENETKL